VSNRRFILFFLCGILVLSGVLVHLARQARVVATAATRNTLCTLGAESIDALEVVYGGTNAVSLARDASGAWRIASPYSAPADPAVVARILDVVTVQPIGDMRSADELAELHEDYVDFGLALDARVSLRLRAGPREACVRFGARTASGQEVYARTEGLRNVFTLPVASLDAVPGNVDGFRRRALVECAPEEVAGVDLRVPESPYVKLVRASRGWRLAVPVEAPADAAVAERLVAALSRARIADFVLPSAERPESVEEGDVIKTSALVPYGLASETAQSVTLRSPTGKAEQIVFGDAVGTNRVYALVQGGTAVVILDRDVADVCRAGVESLRDTRVFPLVGDERIVSVSLTEGSLVYVLARNADGGWRLAAPVGAPADAELAGVVVERILRLRQSEVPERVGDRDAVRVSISTTAGPRTGVTVPRAVFAACGAFVNLRTKVMLELDPSTVRRVSRREGTGASLLVAREGERADWRVDASAGQSPVTISQDAMKALLAALTRVEAAGVETLAATPMDFARCGLERPVWTIAVDFSGADAVRRNVLLGGVAPGGGRYATVGGADAVFILSRAAVAGLTAPITE